jgi:ABC-type glycerol-3-phosphate transport system substrate-binding protein
LSVTFDGPEGEGALNYLADYYRDGLVQQAALTGGGLPFSSGQIGFYIQVQNNYAVDETIANPELDIRVLPTLEHVKKINFGTVGTYCMLKPNENYDVTAKWISFITNVPNSITLCKASGNIAPRKSVSPDEYLEGIAIEIAKEAPYMRSEPKHVKAREVLNTMNPELEAVFTGQKTAREALDAAAAACNALIAAG